MPELYLVISQNMNRISRWIVLEYRNSYNGEYTLYIHQIIISLWKAKLLINNLRVTNVNREYKIHGMMKKA